MASPNVYTDAFARTLPEVLRVLAAEGIHADRLSFGGEGAPPERTPRAPTDARSEFLANRAMGDCAEKMLAEAIRVGLPDWKVVQYGFTDSIAAGHPDFKRKYLEGLEDTRRFGKRPDLLIFPGNVEVEPDLSMLPTSSLGDVESNAIGAVEVRSSKFEAIRYMAVRRTQRDSGKKSARETPSFTVKVEDLKIVYRWIERCGLPQIYAQVFFDSIYAINFIHVFQIIASGEGFSIEEPAKSQEKATIMIPITSGVQIGNGLEMPKFKAEHHVTELGRHDAYVVPTGGKFKIEPERLKDVLLTNPTGCFR